jgi:hypothetical protein
MSFPYVQSPSTPLKVRENRYNRLNDADNGHANYRQIARPSERYFVISPLLPKKIKYGRQKTRIEKTPFKIIEAYNKEKGLEDEKKESKCSHLFKSLKPKLLHFFSPASKVQSRAKKFSFHPSNLPDCRAEKMKKYFDVKQRANNLTPQPAMRGLLNFDESPKLISFIKCLL